jgi:hypothetical protein
MAIFKNIFFGRLLVGRSMLDVDVACLVIFDLLGHQVDFLNISFWALACWV